MVVSAKTNEQIDAAKDRHNRLTDKFAEEFLKEVGEDATETAILATSIIMALVLRVAQLRQAEGHEQHILAFLTQQASVRLAEAALLENPAGEA